jgi:hypothetical protein
MVANLKIHRRGTIPFIDFLHDNDYAVEQVTDTIYQVSRIDEIPVFVDHRDQSLFFEVDLGSLKDIGSKELYYSLLDINTEILPVSVGVNDTNPDDPRLVLLESREAQNLDENELLAVMSAFEIAAVKIEDMLKNHIK